MKVNYRIVNLVVFSIIVFSIQQSELLTIKRFYTILTVIAAFLMSGILFKLPITYKLAKAIDNLFDAKDIKLYEDFVKLITLGTVSLLLLLFPLRLFLNYDTIILFLVIITSLFLLAYSLITTYLIISTKSIFYKDTSRKIMTQPFEYICSNELHYFITKKSPDNQIVSELMNYNYSLEQRKNIKIIDSSNEAFLGELFLPDQKTIIATLFILIDKAFLDKNRKIFKDKVSNHIFKIITKVNGFDKDSLKTTFNNVKSQSKYYDSCKMIIESLKSDKKREIDDYKNYREISNKLLNEFNASKCLQISDDKHEQFILLCILYFAVVRDKNLNPLIPEEINPNTSIELKNILKSLLQ
ncbi:MAG TPA: hypothetical protein PLH91_03585 [Tenuifilaceae bacterium]|nr:hypothetical protein [Tenuifilaceae bacterium]HPI44291.1 hypothetical protein [Tenuifilaceae bacterium]HPN20886.1 hypothetical protein [Tenuifilaceae bacterium]